MYVYHLYTAELQQHWDYFSMVRGYSPSWKGLLLVQRLRKARKFYKSSWNILKFFCSGAIVDGHISAPACVNV